MTATIATQIRNSIYSLITTPAFGWKTTRKVPVLPVQIGQLPALGVYIIRDSKSPDGDADHGMPRYNCEVMIGIMVLDELTEEDALESKLDAVVDNILHTVLQSNNGVFLRLTDAGGNALVRAVPTINRTNEFPKDGETQYMQCRTQMTIQYQECYPPDLIGEFDIFGLTVQPPNQTGTTNVPHPDNFDERFNIPQ